jgi:hypothetical protein
MIRFTTKDTTTAARSVSGKVLGDLNLDVAEVPLARRALPLLLVRVVGFGCSGGSAFKTAVPVV